MTSPDSYYIWFYQLFQQYWNYANFENPNDFQRKRRKITGNFSLVDGWRLRRPWRPLARALSHTHQQHCLNTHDIYNPNWNVTSEIFRSSMFAVGFKNFLLHFALNTKMSKWKSNICFDFSVWIDFSFVDVAAFPPILLPCNDSVTIAQLLRINLTLSSAR